MATRKIPSAGETPPLPMGRLTRPPRREPEPQPLRRPPQPLRDIPSAQSEWTRRKRA
jgi:hypothetical protein